MNRDRMLGFLAGLALAMVTTGCYRYVPAQIEATPPGTGVQLFVTESGTREAEIAGALREGEPRLRGTVVGVEGDRLLLRMSVARLQDGFTASSIDQAVSVPVGEIVAFQRRELDRLKTGLLIGGGAAAVAGIAVLILDPLGGSPDRPGPDPDEAVIVSLPGFSFPIGR